jgi:hypothetical protein
MKACQRFFYLRTLLLYWCGAELFNPVPCCFYQRPCALSFDQRQLLIRALWHIINFALRSANQALGGQVGRITH